MAIFVYISPILFSGNIHYMHDYCYLGDFEFNNILEFVFFFFFIKYIKSLSINLVGKLVKNQCEQDVSINCPLGKICKHYFLMRTHVNACKITAHNQYCVTT